MDNILFAKWPGGSLKIYLDLFLPCTQAKYRKMLQMVNRDWNADELLDQLRRYLGGQIDRINEEIREKCPTEDYNLDAWYEGQKLKKKLELERKKYEDLLKIT